MGLVLPVLEPQAVGVDTTEDDRGDNDAVLQDSRSDFLSLSFFVRSRRVGSLSRLKGRTMGGWVGIGECILDGELAPEVCGRLSQQFSRPIDMRSIASSL